MCMHTDGEHCAALLCSVPAGDAGVILTFSYYLQYFCPFKIADHSNIYARERDFMCVL